jgi:UDP-N-acetylmuramoylalanine--D-glutamate ligase
VTGTKGKSTTAAIAGALLGWPVGGNSYEPLLDLLARLGSGTPLVCELSSFQLLYLAGSSGGQIAGLPAFQPSASAFQVAIVTSLATDHLDWHLDLEHYHRAKLGVLGLTTACVLAPEAAARARELAIAMPPSPPAVRYERDQFIAADGAVLARRGDLAVLGEHNARNAALAMTVALHLGVPVGAIVERLRTVRPLPHRLQIVHESGGVRFIDDSIATTPEAAMAGIAACASPLAVILGGSEKGATWDALAEAIARRRAAGPVTPVVIGQTGPAIAAALARAGVTVERAGDLDDAIRRGCAALPAGGTVLLSPACASFDMFLGFEDRGARFAEAVQRLRP